MTLVAIHQPTFLPWLGWFDKLARADVLVLLDDVQFPKKGGTWMNRVRMLIAGEPAWVTMPLDRSYHGVVPVREARIDDTKPWREKLVKTLATSYGQAPHFAEVAPVVEEVMKTPTTRVAELNEAGIRRLAEGLRLVPDRLVRQSELGVEGLGTDLLIDVCRAAGGTAYMTGDGADEYLEPERFAEAGLELVIQNFSPPVYPQPVAQHVHGLSSVDALMSCGWDGTARLLER